MITVEQDGEDDDDENTRSNSRILDEFEKSQTKPARTSLPRRKSMTPTDLQGMFAVPGTPPTAAVPRHNTHEEELPSPGPVEHGRSPTAMFPPRFSEIIRGEGEYTDTFVPPSPTMTLGLKDLAQDHPPRLSEILRQDHVAAAAPHEPTDNDDATWSRPPRMSEIIRGDGPAAVMDEDDTIMRGRRSPTMDHPPRLSELLDATSTLIPHSVSDAFQDRPPRLSEIVRGTGEDDLTDMDITRRSPTMLNPPRMSELCQSDDISTTNVLLHAFQPSYQPPSTPSVLNIPPAQPPRLSELYNDISLQVDDTKELNTRRSPTMDRPLRLSEMLHDDHDSKVTAGSKKLVPIAPPVVKTIGACVESLFGASCMMDFKRQPSEPLEFSSAHLVEPTSADVNAATVGYAWGRTHEFIVTELAKTARSRALDQEALSLPWSDTSSAYEAEKEQRMYYDVAKRNAKAELDHWMAQVLEGTLNSIGKHNAKLEDDVSTLTEWHRLCADALKKTEAEMALLRSHQTMSQRAESLESQIQSVFVMMDGGSTTMYD